MQADKKKFLRRLRIIEGQVKGVIDMVEEDRYCIDISNQIMAISQALKGVNREVLSAHLHHCVLDSMESKDADRVEEKLEEINQASAKLSK